jgi:hypothetical protein
MAKKTVDRSARPMEVTVASLAGVAVLAARIVEGVSWMAGTSAVAEAEGGGLMAARKISARTADFTRLQSRNDAPTSMNLM